MLFTYSSPCSPRRKKPCRPLPYSSYFIARHRKARCVLHLAFTVFNKYYLLFFVFFIAFVRLLGSVFVATSMALLSSSIAPCLLSVSTATA